MQQRFFFPFLLGLLCVDAAACPVHCKAFQPTVKAELPDWSNWMQRLPETRKKETLLNLTLPGSYQAGSFGLTRLDFRSQRLLPQSSCEQFMTQGVDLYHQLRSGSRFLQLELVFDGSVWRTEHHNMYGPPLQRLLTQIVRFLTDFESEIVIVALSSLQDARSGDGEVYGQPIDQLQQMIQDTFQSLLIPEAVGFSMSIQELVARNTRAIVEIQDAEVAGRDALLWNYLDHVTDSSRQTDGRNTKTQQSVTVSVFGDSSCRSTALERAEAKYKDLWQTLHVFRQNSNRYPRLGHVWIVSYIEMMPVSNMEMILTDFGSYQLT